VDYYTTGSGLNEESNHVTFLTVQVFPVRYSPGTDTITHLNQCLISITYTPPTHSPFPIDSLYDLVIIAPVQFVLPYRSSGT